MSKELELYKAFIDGLVERKDSMTALWVKGGGFPKTEDNKAKKDWSFIRTVNPIPTTILRACTMTSSAVVTAMSGRNKRRRPGRGEGGRSDLDQLLYRRDFWTGTPA